MVCCKCSSADYSLFLGKISRKNLAFKAVFNKGMAQAKIIEYRLWSMLTERM
jgi:hypothetical protein